MKKSEETNILRIALGLTGIATNNRTVDTILEVQKQVKRLGGKFSVSHAAKIEIMIEKKYAVKTKP